MGAFLQTTQHSTFCGAASKYTYSCAPTKFNAARFPPILRQENSRDSKIYQLREPLFVPGWWFFLFFSFSTLSISSSSSGSALSLCSSGAHPRAHFPHNTRCIHYLSSWIIIDVSRGWWWRNHNPCEGQCLRVQQESTKFAPEREWKVRGITYGLNNPLQMHFPISPVQMALSTNFRW